MSRYKKRVIIGRLFLLLESIAEVVIKATKREKEADDDS